MSQVRRAKTATRRRPETIPLMVRVRSGLRVSDKTFWRLCRDNPDLRLERTARGELIVMMPAGTGTGFRNAGLTAQLWNWNRNSALGHSFDSSAGYRLPNGATRSPDASWITKERWEAVPYELRERFAPICPDFVVELMSPSDELPEVRGKLQEYIDQGARLGWLIDPKTGLVEIYRPGRPTESLTRPRTLDGEDVLPGFVLDLRDILPGA
ncbi:MAG TPA: Uma2 family endonuclease [Isosphaeraceae bacterium]|jgi:Uma2 family endonuclease